MKSDHAFQTTKLRLVVCLTFKSILKIL